MTEYKRQWIPSSRVRPQDPLLFRLSNFVYSSYTILSGSAAAFQGINPLHFFFRQRKIIDVRVLQDALLMDDTSAPFLNKATGLTPMEYLKGKKF